MSLSIEQFVEYFEELNGFAPFTWQKLFAEQVLQAGWPDCLKAPTASGKTSLVDIAVFAMAVEATMSPEDRRTPRRLFFVVDRRIVVDETFRRAERIAGKLSDHANEQSVLGQVNSALVRLANGGSDDHSAPALDCVQLRGGIYRDNRWARSLIQPMVISSTVDQIGSRMLFRGYGVSEQARPIHAALVTCDALIILDEAHLSNPFSQTLAEIKRYQSTYAASWAEHPIRTPFAVVEMTATPPETPNEKSPEYPTVFSLDSPEVTEHVDIEGQDRVLHQRRTVPKPARLNLVTGAKGKLAQDKLAKAVAKAAREMVDDEAGVRNVAVMVNRVATARKVFADLLAVKKRTFDVELVIGRMRPVDRDALTSRLEPRLATGRSRCGEHGPLILVSTQCLEAGADFDFDGLVTECASIDALRQRFGRLARHGDFQNTTAAILLREDQQLSEEKLLAAEKKGDPVDPIYENSLSRTWNWLSRVAANEQVDFGIVAMNRLLEPVSSDELLKLESPKPDAPILFHSYLDNLAQTSPAPAPEPDVSIFLHGPRRERGDVQVCWRADLTNPYSRHTYLGQPQADELAENWTHTISLASPAPIECLPVPIAVMRGWLTDSKAIDLLSGDVAGIMEDTDSNLVLASRACLTWRGKEQSIVARNVNDLRPGDTLVLPIAAGGWNSLGYIPDAQVLSESLRDEHGKREQAQAILAIDVSRDAIQSARAKTVLRIHPNLRLLWPSDEESAHVVDDFFARPFGDDERLSKAALIERLHEIVDRLNHLSHPHIERVENLLRQIRKFGSRLESYDNQRGLFLTTRKPDLKERDAINVRLIDDEGDELSAIEIDRPIGLTLHMQHVANHLESTFGQLVDPGVREELIMAARYHDLGKADIRFQAMLLSGYVIDASSQHDLWAKHPRAPKSRNDYLQTLITSELPKGFRHELLSTHLLQASEAIRDVGDTDLVLHLIATHHGFARSIAPVLDDPQPPEVELDDPISIAVGSNQRIDHPPHSLSSGITERFWTMVRRYGWWGIAWLESMLRLADQQVSSSYVLKAADESAHHEELAEANP